MNFFKNILIKRRNEKITKRIIQIFSLAISKGEYLKDIDNREELKNIISIIENRLYISNNIGSSISNKNIHDWIHPHWITALSKCYTIEFLSKKEKNLLFKSEKDVILILKEEKTYKDLEDFLEIYIIYEKYELAAIVRDILKEEKI